jgi:hypothetical protein
MRKYFEKVFANLLAAKHCYRHLFHEHEYELFNEQLSQMVYIPVGWYYTALLTTDNHLIIGWVGGGRGGEGTEGGGGVLKIQAPEPW